MNLLEELKKYLIYFEELGFEFLPVSSELIRLLKNENTISEDNPDTLKQKVLKCEKCTLHRIRKQPIWGEGNLNSKLMLISGYPDKDEDFYNKPFVGQIGELLDRMLQAIKLSRKDFFITHAVKCKTPGGRPPEKEELESCKPFLLKQIKYINPKLILALGFTPPKVFLEGSTTFSSIRGRVFKIKESIPVIFTYHPAYILKNPAVKRMVWEDLQMFRKIYEEIFKGS